MLTKIAALWRAARLGRRAVTAIEYSLIASLIAVLIIASLRTLGTNTSSSFNRVATTL